MKCKICNGQLGILGQLGNMIHLMCRGCGAMFYQEARGNKRKKYWLIEEDDE